jgi:hypothetical protein
MLRVYPSPPEEPVREVLRQIAFRIRGAVGTA